MSRIDGIPGLVSYRIYVKLIAIMRRQRDAVSRKDLNEINPSWIILIILIRGFGHFPTTSADDDERLQTKDIRRISFYPKKGTTRNCNQR